MAEAAGRPNPRARLTGIEGMMKLVIFLFWILLQVA